MKNKKTKTKTKKSIAKRFKVTKKGIVFRSNQGMGHRKAHKKRKGIKAHKKPGTLTGKQAKRIKKVIGK